MVSAAFLPRRDFGPDCQGLFLTFVVPSPQACNLACSFCLVRQRQEWTPDHISAGDLALFVRQAAEREPIVAISIQGYEPLLPDSLPYATTLLTTGKLLGIPTGLVTNGVLLGDAIDVLAAAMPTAIAVSLDAGSADQHDRIRGVQGSWVAAITGIQQAVMRLPPQISVVVSSVLQPAKAGYLESLPARLRDIGVDYWIVNPLLRISRNGKGGLVDTAKNIFRDLMVLQDAANRAGISLVVDDEFNLLRHSIACVREPELRFLYVRTRPPSVDIFRLAPNGQCSFAQDILKQVTPDSPRWWPNEMNAGEFIELIRRGAYLTSSHRHVRSFRGGARPAPNHTDQHRGPIYL